MTDDALPPLLILAEILRQQLERARSVDDAAEMRAELDLAVERAADLVAVLEDLVGGMEPS